MSDLGRPVEYVRFGSGAKLLEYPTKKVVAPFPVRSAVIGICALAQNAIRENAPILFGGAEQTGN